MEAVGLYQRYTLIVAYAGIEWIGFLCFHISFTVTIPRKLTAGDLSRLTDLITSVHVSPRMSYLLEPFESKTPLAPCRTAIG